MVFDESELQQQPFAVLVSQSTQDQHSKLVGTFVGEELAEALGPHGTTLLMLSAEFILASWLT